MLLGIHHIGIGVKNLEEAIKNYVGVLGAKTGDIRALPDRGIRAMLLDVGNCKLELVEPIDKEVALAKSIESQGEGVRHICFEVDDIRKTIESLSAKGILLRDTEPRQGLTGQIAFLQEALNGVTIEFVERTSKI